MISCNVESKPSSHMNFLLWQKMLAICKHKEHMRQGITYIFASPQTSHFCKKIIIMNKGQDEPFQTLLSTLKT